MADDVAMKCIFRHRSHMMPIWIGMAALLIVPVTPILWTVWDGSRSLSSNAPNTVSTVFRADISTPLLRKGRPTVRISVILSHFLVQPSALSALTEPIGASRRAELAAARQASINAALLLRLVTAEQGS
jgi:hypothetical protein